MADGLVATIEEQMLVQFSGRVNLLKKDTRQILGNIIFSEGEVLRVKYRGFEGMKALFNVYVDDLKDDFISIVVEPEIVDDQTRNIHYPYKTIISKLSVFMEEYEKNKSLRPPEGIKLVIIPAFIGTGGGINEKEFQVLATISDYNKIEEIYQHCPLMEYEITQSLITLRQKGALKVIKVQA